jgi:copper chaperone CopZ
MNNRTVKEVKKGIDKLHGVISVSVNSEEKKVAVDFDNTGTNGEEIKNRIEGLGYNATTIKQEEHVM